MHDLMFSQWSCWNIKSSETSHCVPPCISKHHGALLFTASSPRGLNCLTKHYFPEDLNLNKYFISFFFFFFFLRRYNFREVLAFSSFFHLMRFPMQSLQSVIFILIMSLFTSSSHLFLGLPSNLVIAVYHSYTFLTMLLSGIRCTCPNQANLCAMM
jgi:hypothetical protein